MRRALVLLLSLFYIYAHSSVVINEVMSNVRGNDSGIGSPGDRNEFIELYNTGPEAVHIEGMLISDSKATDRIKQWPDSISLLPGITDSILPPYCYAVILDPEYIEIGDSVNYMPYQIPESAYLFTIENTALGDNGISSVEYIVLMDSDSIIIDTYGTPGIEDAFPYDPGDGISMEKINPFFSDGPASWHKSNSESGNTCGAVNSVYKEGSVIDTFNTEILEGNAYIDIILQISHSALTDSIYVIADTENYCFPVLSDTVSFIIPEQAFINAYTMLSDTVSIPCSDKEYCGPVFLNEFMVSGNEWIELYNAHSLNAYIRACEIVNNDTVSVELLNIPADSYIVICRDSMQLETDFPQYSMNIRKADLFALPDREDTITLIWNSITVDSAVRGYENNDASVERISELIPGYIACNWDHSISLYRATPCAVNSINRENTESSNSIYLSSRSFRTDNPVLLLNVNADFVSGILNVYMLNEMGTIIHHSIIDRYISGTSVIPIKPDISKFRTGMYIMYIDINTDRRYQRKFPVSFVKCN